MCYERLQYETHFHLDGMNSEADSTTRHVESKMALVEDQGSNTGIWLDGDRVIGDVDCYAVLMESIH